MRRLLFIVFLVFSQISVAQGLTGEYQEVAKLIKDASDWKIAYLGDSIWDFYDYDNIKVNASLIHEASMKMGFFSTSFLDKQKQRGEELKFGINMNFMFIFSEVFLPFKRLIEDNPIDRSFVKVSPDEYLYLCDFNKVASPGSVPTYGHDEEWQYLYDVSPEGKEWLFSVKVVKEDGKWKIDDMRERFDVLPEIDAKRKKLLSDLGSPELMEGNRVVTSKCIGKEALTIIMYCDEIYSSIKAVSSEGEPFLDYPAFEEEDLQVAGYWPLGKSFILLLVKSPMDLGSQVVYGVPVDNEGKVYPARILSGVNGGSGYSMEVETVRPMDMTDILEGWNLEYQKKMDGSPEQKVYGFQRGKWSVTRVK
ncbi:hypothetical protein [Persicobacter sp. CCB-QB2]|uniref:hypothetical protein n=1 Tax=Persicobacter sp. CCB-QB2 TaxID=1561025 RepID=UPI000B06F9DA|nr:hypothetical protein [Persicobacter sp. CCB-QB2]